MFITTKIYKVLIFVFSCFSYLEQPDHDLFGAALTVDVGIVSRLLSLGVSPDNRSGGVFNETALHAAAFNNSTEVAQLLITHKADIEARDKDNETPLFAAACYNSTEVAQLLITHKADIEARDKYNRTPLDVARNSWWNTEAVVRLLMEHAASIS